jgi:hypothetical protein
MAPGILLDELERVLAAGAQLVEVLPEREYAETRIRGSWTEIPISAPRR